MDTTLTLPMILRARRLLASYLPPTPMWSYPALNEVAGATVYLKHENVQPVGAFKVRGGLTLLDQMPAAERSRGVITYSTGNHAQSIAYASKIFGNRCTVVLPAPPNQAKVRALRGLGATVVAEGADLGESQLHAESLAKREGLRLISPGDEPALLAGVGTLYLEVFASVPDLDMVVVPVGSGSGAAAAGVVAAALAPSCQVIAVQSAASPAAHDSWRSGRCEARANRTVVEGLATGCGFPLPQRLMRTGLADFVLVSDEQIASAQRILASHAHTLAEGAGAAPLAAILADPQRFAGAKIAAICTGSNAGPSEIAALAGAGS